MIESIPFLETVLFISTDKACAPVNTYGMCKAISERIMIEKTQFLKNPKFVTVRYGNVILSRGSIIPLFDSIGKNPEKKEFCVTHKDMTRYFMTLDDSANLIDYAITEGKSGETIIPKEIMSYKIFDIASYFSKKYNKPIKIIGIRPGEKIHETLISFTESLRTKESLNYYVIKPTYCTVELPVIFENGEYNSATNVSENLDDNFLKIIES
jgi:FlaA1/EpsC-like NDP-sugar epimerase